MYQNSVNHIMRMNSCEYPIEEKMHEMCNKSFPPIKERLTSIFFIWRIKIDYVDDCMVCEMETKVLKHRCRLTIILVIFLCNCKTASIFLSTIVQRRVKLN